MESTPPRGANTLRHLDFLVLAVLDGGPRHGYGIVQAIGEVTEGRVRLRPGDVYRVLYRMQRRGWLRTARVAEISDANDERRTYYRLTALGAEIAADEAELMSNVAQRLLASRRDPAVSG